MTTKNSVNCAWWATCRSAVDAPWNDLCLYQNLLKYRQVSSWISESAVIALNRHLCYLSSVNGTRCFIQWHCSKAWITIPIREEFGIKAHWLNGSSVRTIVMAPASENPSSRLPSMPQQDLEIWFLLTHGILLSSWRWTWILLTTTLKTDQAIHRFCHQWGRWILSMLSMTVRIERGVKLRDDFLDTAKAEENYQNILQVVEDHRVKAPSLQS